MAAGVVVWPVSGRFIHRRGRPQLFPGRRSRANGWVGAAPGVGRGPRSGQDVDDLPAHGGPSCGGPGCCGRGGAGEVERDHRARDPGGVGRLATRRQVRRRCVLELGDDLLDDRVVAEGLVCIDQAQARVGDEGVVATRREQLALLGVGSALLRPVKAVKRTAATSASETHRCSARSKTACGYWIGVQASVGMMVIAAVTLDVMRGQ